MPKKCKKPYEKTKLATLLRRYRKEKGDISYRDIASQLNLGRHISTARISVYHWAQGISRPQEMSALLKIAQLLDVQVEDLIEEDEKK
jgi:transcriptional regulator with XRE-family HTH domain